MIGIINYGLGNYKAFENLLRENFIDFLYVNQTSDLDKIKCALLPGVGSFDNAIKKLKSQVYFNELNDRVLKNNLPIMGICVGMHIMLESSEEGIESGLSWLSGRVRKFKNVKIPHLGWNKVSVLNKNFLFNDLKPNAEFYFLHSYFVETLQDYILTNSFYGNNFCSVFKKQNIFGMQFHPEKSHDHGRNIIINFYKNYA